MKLGNIVYVNDLVDHKEVEYINYVKISTINDFVNNGLPTLLVGWFDMKQNGDELIMNQSILEKQIISNQLYWEFSFKENKAQHISGVNYFVNNLPYFYFKCNFSYINIDPVFFSINEIKDLDHILAKKYDAIYNYKGEMLYLLTDSVDYGQNIRSREKLVGIDLDMYEHFDFDMDQLIQYLHKRVPIDQIHNDFEGKIYEEYTKIFPNFDELKRYLVVLLSK